MAKEPNEKHLEFIEDTITRLSDKSFQTRAWCVTSVTALFAFIITRDGTKAILLGSGCLAVALIVLFWCLDSFYLYLEKGYRYLYKVVAGIIPNQKPDFVQKFSMEIPPSQRGACKYFSALFSKVTCIFYIALILIFTGLTHYLIQALGV